MIKNAIGRAPEKPRIGRRGNGARMELRVTRVVLRHPALALWNNSQA